MTRPGSVEIVHRVAKVPAARALGIGYWHATGTPRSKHTSWITTCSLE